jgi:PAS domain S-box-containing protein
VTDVEVPGRLPGGEDRYRSILATADDAYIAMDLAGCIVDWNPKAAQLFGWAPHEVVGRRLDEVIIPERYREPHRTGLARFRATGEAAIFGGRVEVAALHRDGHEFPVELSVWPSEADGVTLLNAFVHDIAGRVQDRELLHQSEERFRRLVDVARDGIALHHEGVIIEANPSFAAMFRVPREELVGRHVGDFAGKPFEELLVERERDDATEPVIAHAERRDGTMVSFELQGHGVLLDGKHARSISLRDRTQEIESGARFELVFDESPLGIGLAGPDFVFTRVNEAICRIYGYSEAEMLSMTFVDLTHPDDVAELVGQATDMYTGSTPRMNCRSRGVRKDGKIIWFQVHASVIKAVNGEILYAIGLVEDITERKREQELFDTFFATSADLLCMANFDGYLTTVNEAWTTSLGWTPVELCAVPFTDFVHPDDLAPTNEVYASQRAAGAPVVRFENRYRCKDGSYRWMEWNAVTLEDQQLVVCNVRDTTGAKALAVAADELNEELSRSNAELEQFAYVASHDLQEPLRMVASYVQLLQRRYKGQLDDDADEFIGFAVDGATRMQSLIQDLLSYSRLGRRPRPFEPVDMAEVVGSVLQVIGLTIEETGAEIRCGDLPTVPGDVTQLTQLLQNLIGNALKYRGEHAPVVEIAAERLSHAWSFSVTDNGIGIDPAYGDRIFNMFQRLHGRDEYSGTGIGLAICKRVVDLHGGNIWVDPGDDGGSTFRFTLPLRHRDKDTSRALH